MLALILVCYWIVNLAIAVVQKICLSVKLVLYLPLATTANSIIAVISGSQGDYVCVGLDISSKKGDHLTGIVNWHTRLSPSGTLLIPKLGWLSSFV